MEKANVKIFFAISVLALVLAVAAGVAVRSASPSGLAQVVAAAPATQKAVQRPTLDLWPLLLTLRHIKAFSGFGWENFYRQMADIAALPIPAQPVALKKFVPKLKTDATVAPAYRPYIGALLTAIANRVQKGNVRMIVGTKFERAVPPVASLAEFLKLGLLPKAVTASLQKNVLALQKLPVEEQMQKLAATALDVQKNKAIATPLRNIAWELHAITAFTLSGASQTVLCTDLLGETAPSTVAACNAQGGTVYDAQCPDIALFAPERKLSADNALPELLPSAYASGGNLNEYVKPDNKLNNCEKAVRYACGYSGIWRRPYTFGKYICGDFALDMKEWLWQMIQGKIRLEKELKRSVVDAEALKKLQSSGKPWSILDALIEKPIEKPDPRVKITGASTDLAPSLIHFFNDAECTDENGKEQKVYVDAATCAIYDEKISETILSEHVISEKNKDTGEEFMAATRKRHEEYATYWQKQRLEEIRNPEPAVDQRASADDCGALGAKVPGWQVVPPSCDPVATQCPAGYPFPTCSITVGYQAGACVPNLANPGSTGYYAVQKVVTSPDTAAPFYKSEFQNVYACATTNRDCPPPSLDCSTTFPPLQIFR